MVLRTAFLAFIAVTAFACTQGVDTRDPIDRIAAGPLKSHVRWLASDKRAGRLTGEAGYQDAAEYVAGQFERFGLAPGGDEGWFQQVPLVRYRLDLESPNVMVHRNGDNEALTYREHYGMSADKVRSENNVRGEVVYAGYGVHAPGFGYSDYDGLDVRGKIVALFDGAPGSLPHAERAYYSSGFIKSREAVQRGAIGFISLRSKRAQEQMTWERYKKLTGARPGMAWVTDNGDAANYFPELEGGITLSAAAATDLFAGTPISFEEALDATAANEPASTPLGIEVSMSRRSTHDRIASPNVIGIVRGSEPSLDDEFVVYTAHLDHIGKATAPETKDDINNGAYDNAMGVSIMLETAKVFAAKPPARSVMFIALTAEESGLLGSDYFAHFPTVPKDKIVANINLDMPLFLYPVADLVAFGSEHSSLEGDVAMAARAEGFSLTPNPLPEESLFVRSDQYSFVRQGVPSIFLVPGFTSRDPDMDGEALFRDHLKNHYHKPSDDMSRPVDWPSAVRFTRSHIRIGYAVANASARPSWNEGDFFGERFAPNR